MTNLEFYKDFIVEKFNEIKQMSKLDRNIHELNVFHSKIGHAICIAYMKDKKIDGFGSLSCEEAIDWLLEEHKEPIKLKHWEKDLIEAYQEQLGVDHAFCSNYILEELKERGHFKGVMDTSMNTQIILENCEVIE